MLEDHSQKHVFSDKLHQSIDDPVLDPTFPWGFLFCFFIPLYFLVSQLQSLLHYSLSLFMGKMIFNGFFFLVKNHTY